jgi:hypothetical protein
MKRYFNPVGNILQFVTVIHQVPAGSREVTIAFNFDGGRIVHKDLIKKIFRVVLKRYVRTWHSDCCLSESWTSPVFQSRDIVPARMIFAVTEFLVNSMPTYDII